MAPFLMRQLDVNDLVWIHVSRALGGFSQRNPVLLGAVLFQEVEEGDQALEVLLVIDHDGFAHAPAHEGLYEFGHGGVGVDAQGHYKGKCFDEILAGETMVFEPFVGHGAAQQADDSAVIDDWIRAVGGGLERDHDVLHADVGGERGDVGRHDVSGHGTAGGLRHLGDGFLDLLGQVILLGGSAGEGGCFARWF